MFQQLDAVDSTRKKIASQTSQKHKADLGQYMTPASVARFMASLFSPTALKQSHLLDAGAGVGTLSCAFLDRWVSGDLPFESVEVTAYEIDALLHEPLLHYLNSYPNVTSHVLAEDYIKCSTSNGAQDMGYTHAILNPPYKKINSRSAHRLALRSVGIETVNLYSAFVALSILETTQGGQIVAIIPRSFCNGPYYRPFRDLLLEKTAIKQIHLFDSRNKAFKDDSVLQENIIIHLEVGGQQKDVIVSTSTDDSFSDLAICTQPFNRIIFPNGASNIIHIPLTEEPTLLEKYPAINYTLDDLGIQVSTGPVVDFRVKEHLRKDPTTGCAPLLYPAHFTNEGTLWPLENFKKHNAIAVNEDTKKWLYPSGFYCIVRRFSSKEEKRRVIASIIDPAALDGSPAIGIENHLNVFHIKKKSLDEELARGLAAYLNTTAIDKHFRKFSGHTQVNATDIRSMKFPSSTTLRKLGQWSKQQENLTQSSIDAKFVELMS